MDFASFFSKFFVFSKLRLGQLPLACLRPCIRNHFAQTVGMDFLVLASVAMMYARTSSSGEPTRVEGSKGTDLRQGAEANAIDNTDDVTDIEESEEDVPDDTDERRKKRKEKQYRCRCCSRRPLYKNTWMCNTCYKYCCQYCIGWNGTWENCTQCTEKQKSMRCCTK